MEHECQQGEPGLLSLSMTKGLTAPGFACRARGESVLDFLTPDSF